MTESDTDNEKTQQKNDVTNAESDTEVPPNGVAMPCNTAPKAKLIMEAEWGSLHTIGIKRAPDYDPYDDYEDFMNAQFWKPVAESKRKIKALKKQIKAEEKVIREHLESIHRFFSEKESDIE